MRILRAVVVLAGAVVMAAPMPYRSYAATVNFPSGTSTVVGSVGFIDAAEIGYFWSVGRGDRVTETFATGEPAVSRAIFDFSVPLNVLNSGASVSWDVSINSVTVGSFTVLQGQTGPVHLDFTFAPIAGPAYTVEFRVTNEVPGGFGSHSLGYAAPVAGTLELGSGFAVTAPVLSPPMAAALVALLAAVGLLAILRRRAKVVLSS